MSKRKIKLVMPMAGDGSRFAKVGINTPKPMIKVEGKPMFQYAVEQIGIDFDEHIFIVRKEHNIAREVRKIYPRAYIIELENKTEGAACTVLLAKEHFTDGSSIFVSNCDQHTLWDSTTAQIIMNQPDVDGLIATFEVPDKNPKWSFAKVDEWHTVTEVAEKLAISTTATTGWYYWKDGREFLASADEMIKADDRVNYEFYLCPVFNYTIQRGNLIKSFNVTEMHGLGTPEDLAAWENKKK